jgi:hypothetical protein
MPDMGSEFSIRKERISNLVSGLPSGERAIEVGERGFQVGKGGLQVGKGCSKWVKGVPGGKRVFQMEKEVPRGDRGLAGGGIAAAALSALRGLGHQVHLRLQPAAGVRGGTDQERRSAADHLLLHSSARRLRQRPHCQGLRLGLFFLLLSVQNGGIFFLLFSTDCQHIVSSVFYRLSAYFSFCFLQPGGIFFCSVCLLQTVGVFFLLFSTVCRHMFSSAFYSLSAYVFFCFLQTVPYTVDLLEKQNQGNMFRA